MDKKTATIVALGSLGLFFMYKAFSEIRAMSYGMAFWVRKGEGSVFFPADGDPEPQIKDLAITPDQAAMAKDSHSKVADPATERDQHGTAIRRPKRKPVTNV